MEQTGRRRSGAVLLTVGGVIEGGALEVGSFVNPPSTTPFGASLLVAYSGAWLLVGAGLFLTGRSLMGRGKGAVKIAGVLAWVVGVVEAIQFVVGAPNGPAPGLVAYFTYAIALAVAGLRLLSDRTLRSAARWSVAIPAACLALSLGGDDVPLLGPVLSLPGAVALPWIATASAGVLLLVGGYRPIADRASFSRRRPKQPKAARL